MRDRDELLLLKKLDALRQSTKNLIKNQPEHIQKLFSIIPIYISHFYDGILQASESDADKIEALGIFANAPIEVLDHVERTLVLWWFWSLDRLNGSDVLNDTNVQAGLSNIWGINSEALQTFTSALDKANKGTYHPISTLWIIVRDLLQKDLAFLFGVEHLGNVQTALQRDSDGMLERIVKVRIEDTQSRD